MCNSKRYSIPSSQADMCKYCAFHDRSMKLGNMLEHTIRRFFGYRDICDFVVYKNGGQFSKMADIGLTFSYYIHIKGATQEAN